MPRGKSEEYEAQAPCEPGLLDSQHEGPRQPLRALKASSDLSGEPGGEAGCGTTDGLLT